MWNNISATLELKNEMINLFHFIFPFMHFFFYCIKFVFLIPLINNILFILYVNSLEVLFEIRTNVEIIRLRFINLYFMNTNFYSKFLMIETVLYCYGCVLFFYVFIFLPTLSSCLHLPKFLCVIQY